jgi:hypothetical protein
MLTMEFKESDVTNYLPEAWTQNQLLSRKRSILLN